MGIGETWLNRRCLKCASQLVQCHWAFDQTNPCGRVVCSNPACNKTNIIPVPRDENGDLKWKEEKPVTETVLCEDCGKPQAYAGAIGYYCNTKECIEKERRTVFSFKPRTFKEDLTHLLANHNMQGGMFVAVQNPDKGKSSGDMVITIETIIEKGDTAAGIILTSLKQAAEEHLPTISVVTSAERAKHDA